MGRHFTGLKLSRDFQDSCACLLAMRSKPDLMKSGGRVDDSEVRKGKIPSECVVRIAGTVRADEEQFEQRLRSGGLYQRPGRKRSAVSGREGKPRVSAVAEDSITTIGYGPGTEHRWASETGSVLPDHPFSPEMVASTKRS